MAQIPQWYSAFAEVVAQQPLVIVAQAVCNQALSAADLLTEETPFPWVHLKDCGPLKSFCDIKMVKINIRKNVFSILILYPKNSLNYQIMFFRKFGSGSETRLA